MSFHHIFSNNHATLDTVVEGNTTLGESVEGELDIVHHLLLGRCREAEACVQTVVFGLHFNKTNEANTVTEVNGKIGNGVIVLV